VEHQKQDWPKHKLVCKKAPSASPTSPKTSTVSTTKQYLKPKPLPEYFPFQLKNGFIYGSSPDGIDNNLLIMLHGLGDKPDPYAHFAKNMALPQTAYLSLRAPRPLFDLGYEWYDSFDEEGALMVNSPMRLMELARVRQSFQGMFTSLIEKCQWSYSNIILLGFSQGATVALDIALNWENNIPLAGVIAISDSIVDEAIQECKEKSKSINNAKVMAPIFITHGSEDDTVPLERAREKKNFLIEQLGKDKIVWKEYRKGHQMISSEKEAKELMEFIAPKIKVRSIALEQQEGLIEITGDAKLEVLKNMSKK
jgi:predicted esterase